MNTYYIQLGEKLRTLRLKNGYTLEYVAERIGLTFKTIQLYETGQRKPSVPTIAKLCKLYDYEVGDLFIELIPYL